MTPDPDAVRDEVRARYAAAALAIAAAPQCCGSASVTFTHRVADGMHGAIVRGRRG